MSNLKIGYTGCYIHDYGNTQHIAAIPYESALLWAKDKAPDSQGGLGASFEEMSIPSTRKLWLNKLFVIVGLEHDKWVCLYNHDGKYSVRTIEL